MVVPRRMAQNVKLVCIADSLKNLGWHFFIIFTSHHVGMHISLARMHTGSSPSAVLVKLSNIKSLTGRLLEPFSLAKKWSHIFCNLVAREPGNGVSTLWREIGAAFPVDFLTIYEPFEWTNWPTFFHLQALIINVSNRFTPRRTQIKNWNEDVQNLRHHFINRIYVKLDKGTI